MVNGDRVIFHSWNSYPHYKTTDKLKSHVSYYDQLSYFVTYLLTLFPFLSLYSVRLSLSFFSPCETTRVIRTSKKKLHLY